MIIVADGGGGSDVKMGCTDSIIEIPTTKISPVNQGFDNQLLK